MRKLTLLCLCLCLSCASNTSPQRPYQASSQEKYFVITEATHIGYSILQGQFKKVSPCEYYPIVGTLNHAGAKYHQITVDNSILIISDKYGESTLGTTNIDSICKRIQANAKAQSEFATKNEAGPYLFDSKYLTKTDDTRELDFYKEKTGDYFWILESNCTYNSELKFSCKDESGRVSNYYVPGIEVPNKFNLAEYEPFGKYTEKGFFKELDALQTKEWDRKREEQRKADEQTERAERERQRAKQKKDEETRLAKLDSLRESGCPLIIDGWSWSHSDYHVTISGKVMNLTDKRITHVKVHAELYDRGGNFITSGWSYLQYVVLMPYQSSPFQIIERWNPLMARAGIRIQLPTGEMIQGSCSMGR